MSQFCTFVRLVETQSFQPLFSPRSLLYPLNTAPNMGFATLHRRPLCNFYIKYVERVTLQLQNICCATSCSFSVYIPIATEV